jgi:hypothetical protein
MGQCKRCESHHEMTRKHDWPPGLIPVGKFTWWKLIRVLGPDVIPPRSVTRGLVAELYHEAAVDGTGIRPGNAALAEWAAASVRGVENGFVDLIRLGLVFKAVDSKSAGRAGGPGRAAQWELAMRMEHELLLEDAGYDLEWLEGTRKYRHAKKRPTSQAVGHSDD